MIAWIDTLYPYAVGGLCGSRRIISIESEEESEMGACMTCGAIDELSFYLCWECIKKKNRFYEERKR